MARQPAVLSGFRPYARRAMRGVETPVIRAFVRLAARQRARGGYTPAFESAVADVMGGLRTKNKKGQVRKSSAAVQALNDLLTATYVDEVGALSPAGEEAVAPLIRATRMTRQGKARKKSPAVAAIVDQFHRLYYDDRSTWRRANWLGVRTWKCPFDMWVYQEMLVDLRPALIVECGTAYGGSANYLARICEIIDCGEVVTIDIKPKPNLPEHPRITYLTGSSTDPAIVDKVRGMLPAEGPVLVILDSAHQAEHVYNELLAYADMVTPGSYLIVEDTNVNGHPVYRTHGPGPMEALDRFLAERDDFQIDRSKERFHLSQNPRGFLRRTLPS